MLDTSGDVGDFGRPSEGLGPQSHPSCLVKARRDPDRRVGAIVVDGPAERGAYVRDLVVDEAVCLDLLRAAEQLEECFGLIGKERRMQIARGLAVRALGEPLLGELPNSLQHGVAELRTGALDLHERLADERIEQIEHLELVQIAIEIAPTHRSRSDEREPAGEYRCSLQHALFDLGQQVIGPLHRVTQRLVPFERTP